MLTPAETETLDYSGGGLPVFSIDPTTSQDAFGLEYSGGGLPVFSFPSGSTPPAAITGNFLQWFFGI